jgi:hypothetical protein
VPVKSPRAATLTHAQVARVLLEPNDKRPEEEHQWKSEICEI